MKLVKLSFYLTMLAWQAELAQAEQWKVTAYCSCVKCCGKADGVTASGKPAKPGYVACNWLPFGTRLKIGDEICVVMDRGAKSEFGSKTNNIKRVDVWMPTHAKARKFGVQYKDVEILKGNSK
jgi:3D (Asp-Asp-Asp) domain-containing protein